MDEISQISTNSINYHNMRLEAALSNLAKDGMAVSGNATKDVVSYKAAFNDFLESPVLEKVAANTRKVERPDSPLANDEGFVTVYDMSQSALVSEALEAYRMYESNIRAYGLYNKMVAKSFEIGK